MKYLLYLFSLLMLFAGACSSSKNARGNGKDLGSGSNSSVNFNDQNKSINGNNSEGSLTRDGSSEKSAIIINETSETSGVAAEYAWLRKHYPGYQMESQALLSGSDGHPYDLLRFKTSSGMEKEIYFDISKFFGHF